VFADYYQPSYGHHRYARPYRHHYARYVPYRALFGYGYHHHGTYGVSLYPAYGYDDYAVANNVTIYNTYPQPEAPDSGTVIIEETVETTLPAENQVYSTEGVVYEESTAGYGQEGKPGPQADASVVTGAGPLVHATEGGSPNEATLVDLGNAAFNVGAYSDAIRYYTAAVLADDSDGFARLFYGLGQFAMGDYDLAVVAFRRALAMEPSLITEPIDLRSIYADAKTFERHRARLLKHVGENADEYESMFLMGYIYFATAEPGNALAMFRSVLELNEADAQTIQLRDTIAEILRRVPAAPGSPQAPVAPTDSGGPVTVPEQ